MCCTIIFCTLCAVLGIPILCSFTRGKLRYYVLFTYFFVANMVGAVLVILCSLPRPRDVRNMIFVKYIFNFMFSIMGIEVIKRNTEYLESSSNYVIVSNHQSALDVIGFYQLMPKRVITLAKKELIYAGTFGIAGWLCGGLVFVDRLNSEKAQGTLRKLAKLIKSKNLRVMIFPEGTRHSDASFLPFKKGAFHLAIEAQVPIIPVVYSTYRHFLSNKQNILDKGQMIATCLPPVSTEGLTANDVNALIERVRNQMLAVFDESSREVQAMAKARGATLICEHPAATAPKPIIPRPLLEDSKSSDSDTKMD